MTRTVGDVVDRVYRDWLHPVDDQPSRAVLDGAIDASATTLSYLDSFLITEEEYLLTPGQLIEIDSELMMVASIDSTINTITVRRGMSGTTAAAHSDNALIIVAPLYSRKAIFDAVRSSIARLFPRLYQSKSVEVTTAESAEIPADARIIEGFFYLDDNQLCGVNVQAFDYPGSSTGRLVVFRVNPSKTGYLLYRAPFGLPTSEADLLEDDLGLEPEYEDLLVFSAASSLVASREFDAASAENLHRQLNSELFPVGSAIRIRRELRIMYNELLDELATNLRSQQGTPISVDGWT